MAPSTLKFYYTFFEVAEFGDVYHLHSIASPLTSYLKLLSNYTIKNEQIVYLQIRNNQGRLV